MTEIKVRYPAEMYDYYAGIAGSNAMPVEEFCRLLRANKIVQTLGTVFIMAKPDEISKEEQDLFMFLRDVDNDVNLCLVKTRLDGEYTSAIAMVTADKEGKLTLRPLAILVTPDLFPRLAVPQV